MASDQQQQPAMHLHTGDAVTEASAVEGGPWMDAHAGAEVARHVAAAVVGADDVAVPPFASVAAAENLCHNQPVVGVAAYPYAAGPASVEACAHHLSEDSLEAADHDEIAGAAGATCPADHAGHKWLEIEAHGEDIAEFPAEVASNLAAPFGVE